MSNSNVIGLLVLLVYLKSKFFQSNTMPCNEKHCPSLAYGIALPPVVRCNPFSVVLRLRDLSISSVTFSIFIRGTPPPPPFPNGLRANPAHTRPAASPPVNTIAHHPHSSSTYNIVVPLCLKRATTEVSQILKHFCEEYCVEPKPY